MDLEGKFHTQDPREGKWSMQSKLNPGENSSSGGSSEGAEQSWRATPSGDTWENLDTFL